VAEFYVPRCLAVAGLALSPQAATRSR
jgi:hypothetical protein